MAYPIIKCPYCGRALRESERYCWFCERDISKVRDEAEKPRCFIATAVFGEKSYEVAVLRRYRDEVMMESFFGRAFVKAYYLVSPAIARYIDYSRSLKKFFRLIIRIILRFIK